MASPAWTSDEIWSKSTFFKCVVVCPHDANAKKSGSFLIKESSYHKDGRGGWHQASYHDVKRRMTQSAYL